MLPDNDTRTLRDQWVIEAAPTDLADRIASHALAHQQHRPFTARVKRLFAMPEQGGYAWKGAFAVAACIMLAIVLMDSGATKSVAYKKPMNQLVEELYLTY